MEATAVLKVKRIAIEPVRLLEFAYWLMFTSFMMVKCFYFQFTTQLNVRPFLSAVNLYMLTATMGTLFIVMGVMLLFVSKRRLLALFILNIVLTTLLVADTNFFRYYYGILTVPVLMQVDLKLLGTVNKSIMSLFKPKDLILILDLPLMLAGLVILKKQGIEKINFKKRIYLVLALLVTGFSLFLAIYSKVDINKFTHNNNYISKKLGILYSHYNNARMFMNDNVFSSKEPTAKELKALDNFFSQKAPIGGNFNGIARDKNLIVIQLESIQQFVINREIGGKEITPNLNKLISDSLYFDNLYYQIAGGNTSDAEFLCNTSFYPAKEGSVYYRFAQNTYHSLPRILKEQNYESYAMHAFTEGFWNRTEMYKALGFDKFINGDDYIPDDFEGWNGEALSDASFFRQSIDKLGSSNPFYAFMITLSSHHPFTAFKDHEFYTAEFEGTYMGNYIKAAHYADKCVGEFINDLEKRGILKDTLLVLYGDHSAVPKHLAGQMMDLVNTKYSELEWTKLQKVPLIIHYPGLKNGEKVSTTGGEIDILPTIANLMDFEAPYAIGKDLLNTQEGYAVLRNGSVITDDYVFLNDLGEVFDIKTGSALKKKDYEKEINTHLNELAISDLIIQKDALKNWHLQSYTK